MTTLKNAVPAEIHKACEAFPLKNLNKGESFFDEGDAPAAVYYLRQGLVKTIKYSSKDVPTAIDFVLPGHFFGMIAVLDGRKYPVTALALRPSEAIRIPSDVFLKWLGTSDVFRQEIYRQIGRHVRNSQALRTLMEEPVEKRVAHILIMLNEVMGPEIRLLRDDIATMAGCTSSTAVRTLIEFRKRKWIETSWKKIRLLRPSSIRELASFPVP